MTMGGWWASWPRPIWHEKKAPPVSRRSAESWRPSQTRGRTSKSELTGRLRPWEEPACKLAVYRTHTGFGITFAGGHSSRCHLVDLLQIGQAELHLEGGDILLQVTSLFGSRYRHDVLTLDQEPSQCQLRRTAFLP